MNPGKKEDRRNRWVFGPFIGLTLGTAVLPAYLDGRNLWTADETVTPYVGLTLLRSAVHCAWRRCTSSASRFTGLVAIQEGHRLQTGGLYRYIRHPSYAGMLLSTAGYVLVFRCWLGLLLVAAMFAVLVARMNAEEALLEGRIPRGIRVVQAAHLAARAVGILRVCVTVPGRRQRGSDARST